jgi:hypothetical protein
VNENSGAIRFDYKPNATNAVYVRFFRDQGFSDQPQDVSGARAGYRSVPQNGAFSWQTTLGADKINEFKFGYNSAYSRVFGSAPTVNGIDLSAVTINITGSVANTGIPARAPHPALPCLESLPAQFGNQWSRSTLYTIHAELHR